MFPDRLTSYVFRVFALAYPIMATSVLDLHSLCTTANWIITQRQAEDGHFLEEGAVIMAWMQVPTPTPPRTPPPSCLACSNKTQALCTDR